MNPVLWILVLLAAVLLWFIISFIFVPLGRFVLRKWDNVMGILNNDEQKEEEVNGGKTWVKEKLV